LNKFYTNQILAAVSSLPCDENESHKQFGFNLEVPEDEFQANLPPEFMTDDVAESSIYSKALVSIRYCHP
jgi:hypothetical protein